ncbi:hypothetical protein [Xanthobacter agilis]|jgi:hypothetical protein|uniref:DUF1127 domain-containing protein n=1 Tax=Xanthobacter agilis TaxID=47492 RepID=A0ABU0LC24_XANAG|nr:hypothetical protein [Xanthobacter agilis]MDQ0504681.1 hypothetical protein [Xanthobacter agilis]
MATVHANGLQGHGFIARVGAAMSEFFTTVAEARRMADRYEDPTHLGNSEFERMGLTREDVPETALHPKH